MNDSRSLISRQVTIERRRWIDRVIDNDRRDQRISSIHRYDRDVALEPYHSTITRPCTSYSTLYICFNTSRNVEYT
jgi:hypothetical protein